PVLSQAFGFGDLTLPQPSPLSPLPLPLPSPLQSELIQHCAFVTLNDMVQMLFSNLSLIAHKDSEQKKTLLKEKTDGTGEGVGDREGEEEEGTTAVLGVGGDSGVEIA
ncbi:MAG: hypothetical protein MPL62_17560, partial [Alphaproteobacteria bacterium]|nr:hypothetical protein [Alphaproteobacteria bacterium]